MVSTYRTYRNNIFMLNVTFNDTRTFNLKSQLHEVALDAILCEKGKVLTDITGYTNRSLLTSEGTTMGPYRVHQQALSDIAEYTHGPLVTLQSSPMVSH